MTRSLLRLSVACLLVALSSPPAAAAVDRFYQEQMTAGIRALDQGAWEEAARLIRIACFGYLEEPVALAAGLVHLATAQAALGDRSAFGHTFARIADLEERFSAYSDADIPDDFRLAFESQAARLVPLQTLRSAPGFESVAERGERRRWANLPPERRRADLEGHLEREPENARWLVEMARLELEERRPRRALDWLDQLPGDAATSRQASCLRQQAATERGNCARMDLEQPFCTDAPASVMEFRLVCLVEARRWPEAAALLSELPAQSRASRRVTRLAEKIEAQGVEVAAPPADSGPEEAAGPGGPAASEPIAEPRVPRPVDDPAELATLRERLEQAASQAELRTLFVEARQLGDRRPQSPAAQLLAAEVAYLLSDWPQAVAYFRRAGAPAADDVRRSFYFAVALYELGERAEAAAVLAPVTDRLERTPFVDGYVERILAAGGG